MPENEYAERPGIKVRKVYGEQTRRELMNIGKLDTALKISQEKEFLFFPLKEDRKIPASFPYSNFKVFDYELVMTRFVKRKDRISGDYKEHLVRFPTKLFQFLPSSFDVIGDLGVIKLHREVVRYNKKIASAILQTHSHIKGVFQDLGVMGKFRIRELRHIGGENRTHTVHKEYGINLKVDISEVYFTPRLAWERNRIGQIIEEKERVLDMFTGVGPFAITIGKRLQNSEIHAIDSNPRAIQLLNENISLNKINNIIPHLGDAREWTLKLGRKQYFDRIIMNLPLSSLDFLESALTAIDSGILHIYTILKRDKLNNQRIYIRNIIKNQEKNITKFSSREIKGYSPSEAFMVHDVAIK